MMAEENSHVLPLAPPRVYRRSDDQEWGRPRSSLTSNQSTKPHDDQYFHHRSSSSKCFVYFFTLLVFLCLSCLVFALIVLRIAYPRLELEAVRVNRLSYGVANNNQHQQEASLKATVSAELKLSNGNFGRFRFQTGSASVVYGNSTLGVARIGGGVVGGKKAERINVVVELKSNDDLAGNANFSSDVGSNNLVKLNSYAQLRGEVRVVKIVTKHRTSFMNCSFSLNLTSQAIQDLLCI